MTRIAMGLLVLLACGEAPGPDPDFGLAFEPIDTDVTLTAITDFRFIPDSDELLVLDKAGTIHHMRIDGDDAASLGSLRVPGVYSELDCGLISIALDPDFMRNRYVYIGMCIDLTSSAIMRLTFAADDLDGVASTAVEILRAGDILADRPWHNIGAMGFEPSGVMWALLGDKNVRGNGQSADDTLGSVVRIVPSRDPDRGGHEPAPDNPGVGAAEPHDDVAAMGLRSPWRGAMDSSGRLWIGDVGAEAFEEINVLDRLGTNFGWALHEGQCNAQATACAGLTDPVVQWPHEGGFDYLDQDALVTTSVSRAAWVGVEHVAVGQDPYDGRLEGHMLFGDFCLGFVRGLALGDTGAVVSDVALGHLAHASAWAQGTDGYLYASTFGSCDTTALTSDEPPIGRLWRAVPN